MSSVENSDLVREAVAIFEDLESMQGAIDELENSGFNLADFSFVAGEKTVEEKLGHIYNRVEELTDDPKVPTTTFVPNEMISETKGALIGTPLYIAAATATGITVAAGGPLALTIGAAVAAGGAGAAIGGVLAKIVGDRHAKYLQEQIDRGGLILWVRARDEAHGRKAVKILSKYSSHDVELHGQNN